MDGMAQAQNAANLFVSEQSDYWNIDDILAEEELVPCTFKSDAKNLAHLELLDQQIA